MTTARAIPRNDVALAGLAALAGIAAYAMTVTFEFVWDDQHILAAHPEFVSLANWKEIITSSWWLDALYRPLTQLSLAVDWVISNGNPNFFHATNVALNAAATIGVFALARCWLGRIGAFGAALLFTLHPVHVEAVASVVGRAEVLVAIFAVAAALLYRWDGILAARDDQSWKRAVSSFGTLGALLLGLASKESAFAIPGILLIVDWLESQRRHERFSRRLRRHWVLFAAAFVLSVEWLVLRTWILGDIAGDHPAPGLWGEGIGGRALVMAPVVLEYLRLFLIPLHLSADYSPNFIVPEASVTLKGLLGLAATGMLFWVAVAVRRTAPLITFGLAWIGGTLLIVANVIVPTGVLLAERTLYLPSIGLALLAGWGVEQLMSRRSARVTAVVVGGVSLLWGWRTVTRVPVWRDSSTFLPHVVSDAPGSYRGFWLAGTFAFDGGDAERGIALVRQAITIYPLWLGTWRDLGKMLMSERRWAEAADAYNAAFRLEPTSVEDGARAVTGYALSGMLDSARAVAGRARQVDPHDPLLLSALATLASQKGHKLEAMTWQRQAAWQRPNDAGLWYLTAFNALAAGYCPEAERAISRLRALGHPEEQVDQLVSRAAELGCQG
jgi:protein O-mannosyl-transferase